jgi:hypothetical protein
MRPIARYPELMALTVELNPETEARLAAEARVRGLGVAAYAAKLLEEATPPPTTPRPGRTTQEIRAWLNELTQFSDKIPPRPGETFSREMIYQDHD